MRITPLTGYCGAEITEVDLRSLSPSQAAELDQAITDYKVLAFRDQFDVSPQVYSMWPAASASRRRCPITSISRWRGSRPCWRW